MRIAIGGFQHETNTFAPSKATFDDFVRGGGWPPLLTGEQMFEGVHGMNLPLAGFIAHLSGTAHQLLPAAWASATPSAHVTEDAYERFSKLLLDGIRKAEPEAVYLDLHGAMVAEHIDDGEGEILRRVRNLVGNKIPVVASLDLHANVSAQMLELADGLIGYRTYPHNDMAETGMRAAKFLQLRIAGMARPAYAWRQMPFLIPLNAQSTDLEPARSIYRAMALLESLDVPSISFCPGFPAADFADCGATVWAYGLTEDAAKLACNTIADMVERAEAQWEMEIYDADAAVKRAMRIALHARKPVVIADTQDNPGAGGDSNTTGMLRALVANNAQRAAFGLVFDREAALAAHHAGPGAKITIDLGAVLPGSGEVPFHGTFLVERISDGRLTGTGPFYGGAKMTLGPCARLSIGGVKVIVASEKVQLADQEMYRFVGIEPTEQAILVNKSSVHFRADFTPIAEEIIVARSPGAMPADPSTLSWKKLRRGIRLKPNGPVF
ncbi:MAG: M81 family metallopeptidase [Casimicrobiaceae bacterium]